jgi:hypothetical protein
MCIGFALLWVGVVCLCTGAAGKPGADGKAGSAGKDGALLWSHALRFASALDLSLFAYL